MKNLKHIKPILSLALAFCSLQGIAQTSTSELKDDLTPSKKEVAAKYFPSYKGKLLYKVYAMPIAELQQKLGSFKAALLPIAEKQENTATRELAKKDVDFIARVTMKNIVGLYGMDSVGMHNMEKILADKKGDPNFTTLLMEAQTKAFTKRLTSEERKKLLTEVYADADFNNEALFKRSAAYREWLGDYIDNLKYTKYVRDTAMGYNGFPYVKFKIVKNEIPDGLVKDYLTYQYASQVIKMVKNDAVKKEVYDSFMASATNAAHKKDIETTYANYKMMSGNALSPEFSYAAIDGKKVSLKSLRGKYVYIDVWATWCAPCKAEIPFLQKVEHDYKDKNIHFVSLSVDKIADKGKWASYVRDNKLGGIQVMADKDFSSDFIKGYNIMSIPRFILIDPEGRIVDGDAKRPSDTNLRAQFDKLLK